MKGKKAASVNKLLYQASGAMFPDIKLLKEPKVITILLINYLAKMPVKKDINFSKYFM